MATAGAPLAVSEFLTLVDKTINKPVCRLVASGQQALPDNTATAINFTTEDVDTHGFHDNAVNPSRITPTRAGWYTVRGTVFFETQATPVISAAWIRKNGATNLPPAGRDVPGTQAFSRDSAALVAFNGTTDYVELIAQQDSAGADNTNQSSQFSSVLECIYERDL